MRFNKIAIIGVGLMGGSIALAARRKKLAKEIVGVCRREVSRRKALKFRAVNKATLDLKQGTSGADLVIIAAPVGKIVNLARRAAKFMKKGAILSDVGSAKRDIVKKIEKFTNYKTHFVGSHPMAGSDKTGVENASADIFNKALVIITKTKNSDKKSIATLRKFWERLGCRVLILSPQRHDRLASLASYLPHVVSFVLSSSQTKDSVKIAGGSLKDTTRVASSEAELWKDIFLLTQAQTLKAIRIFSNNLKALEKALKAKDEKALTKFLERARRIRGQIKE